MRSLVESGWAPSQAARAILNGTILDGTAAGSGDPATETAGPKQVGVEVSAPSRPELAGNEVEWLSLRFLGSARALDDAGMESALDEGLALLGVDEALERLIMPALVDVGAAWARGDFTVAAEHAASNAVMRRLAGLYEAAATPSSRVDLVVGLPPGSRHEVGALAFAVACRRARLRVLYLGADVPVASWLVVADEHPGAAVVLGAVTPAEADSAAEVVVALRSVHPDLPVYVGGAGRARTAKAVDGVTPLPEGLRAGAAMLAGRPGAG
jgi:methanogenic corrinoid protein MtbC1